ncbi:hypothetical protein V8E54_011663 [Elaphomyces granulatus]
MQAANYTVGVVLVEDDAAPGSQERRHVAEKWHLVVGGYKGERPEKKDAVELAGGSVLGGDAVRLADVRADKADTVGHTLQDKHCSGLGEAAAAGIYRQDGAFVPNQASSLGGEPADSATQLEDVVPVLNVCKSGEGSDVDRMVLLDVKHSWSRLVVLFPCLVGVDSLAESFMQSYPAFLFGLFGLTRGGHGCCEDWLQGQHPEIVELWVLRADLQAQ